MGNELTCIVFEVYSIWSLTRRGAGRCDVGLELLTCITEGRNFSDFGIWMMRESVREGAFIVCIREDDWGQAIRIQDPPGFSSDQGLAMVPVIKRLMEDCLAMGISRI